MSKYFEKAGEFVPDTLFAGTEVFVIPKAIPIEVGQGLLKRGTAIGRGSDKKFYILGKTVSSVTIVPYGVLADDVDTDDDNSDTVVGICYLSGMFNKNAIIFDTGANIEDYEDDFRTLSIYFKEAK